MLVIQEWQKWILKQLICEGIHRSISESQLFREAGRHYEPNFQSALRSLIDEGIVMVLESHRLKKYLVNFDMIDVAQSIINSQSKLNRIKVIQPFMPEPEGFIYWFDNNQEDRKYRRQNIYRFYTSKTDKMEFGSATDNSIDVTLQDAIHGFAQELELYQQMESGISVV